MNRHRLVRVPASSANLGPGYDVLAAALSLTLELEVEETGEFFVALRRAGRSARPLQPVRARLRGACTRPTGLRFQIRSEIPPSAGLGSSAAAIVAGLAAADHMYELDAPLFELARRARGPSRQRGRGAARRLRGVRRRRAGRGFDPPPGLEGVVAIPPDEVPTAEARAALPAEVPLGRRRAQRGHASLLMLGLATDDFSLIGRGLADRLHQTAAPISIRARWSWSSAPGARRGRRDDLGRRADRPVLVSLGADRRVLVARLRTEAPDCDVRRVTFAPGGADVSELE